MKLTSLPLSRVRRTDACIYPFRMSGTSRTNGTVISSSERQKTNRTTEADLTTIQRWKTSMSKRRNCLKTYPFKEAYDETELGSKNQRTTAHQSLS